MKSRLKIPQEPDFVEKVKYAKERSGERTLSKTVLMVFNYGFSKLFTNFKK